MMALDIIIILEEAIRIVFFTNRLKNIKVVEKDIMVYIF